MNRESDNMVLAPYNLDPEFSVKGIDSQQLIEDTTTHPSAFSVQLQSFQNVYKQLKYCFGCFPKICVKNVVVPEFCLSTAILESVSLANEINRNRRRDVE